MSDINWKRNGPSLTGKPYRHSWEEMSEDMPVDVLPCSNDEYFPPDPSREQLAIMDLASREAERMRTKFNMSRRAFVRTAAATSIGFWAIDAVRQGDWGNYGWAKGKAKPGSACDLEYDGGRGKNTLNNLKGEFIFDVQSHHVDRSEEHTSELQSRQYLVCRLLLEK